MMLISCKQLSSDDKNWILTEIPYCCKNEGRTQQFLEKP